LLPQIVSGLIFPAKHESAKTRLLLLAAAALLLPALLINLGMVAFYDDEGIRSLVALEMKISGNYITPTLFGEFYYNKPPLYNWILLLIFELSGRVDEFSARLPTVFFLLAYATTVESGMRSTEYGVWHSPKRQAPFPAFGISTALAVITCGRILFWDSMLAFIDICFSWVMFTMFMVIYGQGERGRYGRMFAGAYFLAATGFLLKGLPSLVFLGISLSTYLVWQKKWRHLFTWAHAGGAAIFSLLVGGYYALYARHNGLDEVFKTLLDESAKRTFAEYGIGQTVLHLLTFPFEMWYHFLPWALLAVYFFRKNALRLIRENRFVTYCLLIFFTTILPYWSSVEVYPRYLFMHVPLVFAAFFYLHFKNREESSRMWRVVEGIFFALCLLATFAAGSLPFLGKLQQIPQLYLKAMTLELALAFLTCLYWRWRSQRLLVFVLVMLVVRIGFNWFVLPLRQQIECSTLVRESSIAAAKLVEDKPLYIYDHSLGFQPTTGFYFTKITGQIVHRRYEDFDTAAVYIIHPELYPPEKYEPMARFRVRWECKEMVLGKLK
jgi:4-amino-4-deoxy-L-arabinose transferase-like glycosyltransferase